TWPVEHDHFPRIAPFFWDLCGMGPITRDVEGARTVMRALRSSLRRVVLEPKIDPRRVVVWAPDKAHEAEWPTFRGDVGLHLDRLNLTWSVARELPTPSRVNALFTEYLAANFDSLIAGGDLPLAEGVPAVLLALLSRGRLDRRVHPNT